MPKNARVIEKYIKKVRFLFGADRCLRSEFRIKAPNMASGNKREPPKRPLKLKERMIGKFRTRL